jgi:hypothetical protein
MTPTGDTWGISGPLFLMAFAVLAVAVTVAVVRMRHAVADVPATQPLARLDARSYDVAYLNGGPHLAVCAALSAMHRSGTVATAGRGAVLAAGRPEPRSDELERGVHHAAATPVPRRRLADVGAVASALHRIESRLVAAGLLLSPQQQDRIRRLAGVDVRRRPVRRRPDHRRVRERPSRGHPRADGVRDGRPERGAGRPGAPAVARG